MNAALRGLVFAGWALAAAGAAFGSDECGGWRPEAPRAEIRPVFRFEPKGGPDGKGSWRIEADGRPGLAGYWTRTVPVRGGGDYHFSARRKTEGLALSRRSTLVQIFWEDGKGDLVPWGDRGAYSYIPRGLYPTSEPEYPPEGKTDGAGWTELAGTYTAPPKATRAEIRLHYRWEPKGRVEWAEIRLIPVPPPPPRIVRLAAVNYRPTSGRTPREKREQFAPFIARAGAERADLVVLPETLTIFHGESYAEGAEPIPGPSTAYFGGLAKKYRLYIVAGLVERAGDLVYNTAVLVGPDGALVGKYRKTTLPRVEVDAGVAPGDSYPVFPTRFGKVAIMTCYDSFFPEVARNLADRGAEVIAFPVAGYNPLLLAARACENGVYIVSSCYDTWNWSIAGGYEGPEVSGIYDWEGRLIARDHGWGTVALAEVDLNHRVHWGVLGDYKAELPHSRPPWSMDATE